MWRVTLAGADITSKVDSVSVSFAAENVAGDCTIELADRNVLAGVIVPRVPRELLLSVDKGDGSAAMSFYLESIDTPQSLTARTATIWGRSASARLYRPWAQKVSKQWQSATTIDAILQDLAALCGVTISVVNDYDICAYCYTVSDQYPSEILQDLATRSGQILWPQTDGSLVIAPRLYTYGAPDVVLTDPPAKVETVTREVPDFGNRILISGDSSVAGLAVQVVPLVDDSECVAADGQATVRLIAVVTGADGLPVALGTEVEWSASSGLLASATSDTAEITKVGEAQRSTDYRHVTLDLPAESVVGVYARRDTRKVTNLYRSRGGSVSGRVITFSAPLDYYDQALVIDYVVKGAPNTWTAGWTPGDVTVLASVAGAQGFATLHQSNPTACATQLSLEAHPSSPCLGDDVVIVLRAIMFGGAGIGAAIFGLTGCGSLSATRKTLTEHTITETLRTSTWGGAKEVRLTAIPAAGTTPVVYLTGTTAADLYDSHDGQVVILSDGTIPDGTQVDVTYAAGGTAAVTWSPTDIPSGNEPIYEVLQVAHVDVGGVMTAQVTLTRTPVAAPECVPKYQSLDFYASHDTKVVSLKKEWGAGGNELVPEGHDVTCTYESIWRTQPECAAIISVRVEDGSEDGGRGQISLTARDCRTVNPGSTDPSEIPDETVADESDTTIIPDLEEEEDETITATGCDAASINARTPVVNTQNAREVYGVPSVDNCPGVCTCDQICTALRSTGRLAAAGMTWSTCMAACAAARSEACDGCTLSGPSTLEPGEEGTWTDGKTNSGEWSGQLDLVSRTFEGGYTAKMPDGGAGPFTIQVCYGEDARTCCEAEVDFPACSLSGPSSLAQGEEGEFVPSLGMSAAEAVVDGMVLVRQTESAFIAKLAPGACEGSIMVTYGGRLCGVADVTDSYSDTVGVVVGDDYLAGGDTGYFAHNLAGDVEYTGTLALVDDGEGGAILQMPEGASGSYTASWSSRCGVTASMTVNAVPGGCSGATSSGTGDVPEYFIIAGECYTKSGVSVYGRCGAPTGHWITTELCVGYPVDGQPCACSSDTAFDPGNINVKNGPVYGVTRVS
jgi:hypothetical protein